MKKFIALATFLLVPTTTFAGGYGLDLSQYKRVTGAPLANTQINVKSLSETRYNTNRREERRSTGYRTPSRTNSYTYRSQRSPREAVYTLNQKQYNNVKQLVDAYNDLDENLSSYLFNGKEYSSFALLAEAMTSILRGNGIYFLEGNLYANYWAWVTAYRASNGEDRGVTRSTTTYRNYGNAYNLSTGLEPIDPQENQYRGLSRETERQNAAKLKLLRMRGIE